MQPLFVKTNKSREDITVVAGMRGANGKEFFLLHRIKNIYAKNPLFIVEYSSDVLSRTNEDGTQTTYRKLYVYQTPPDVITTLQAAPIKNHQLGLFASKELKALLGNSYEKLNPIVYQDKFAGEQLYVLTPHTTIR